MRIVFICFAVTLAFHGWVPEHTVLADENFSGLEAKINLPVATRFRSASFSVAVPKGWSAQLSGANNMFSENLTMAPNSNLAGSESYLGIHVKSQVPSMTLEQRQAKFAGQIGKSTKIVVWNGVSWLLVEYAGSNSSGRPTKLWAAFASGKHSEYTLMVGAPVQGSEAFWKSVQDVASGIQIQG